jgi:hypothetical protein
MTTGSEVRGSGVTGERPPEGELIVRASLDVPGETRRQVMVFAIWFVCLLAAVVLGSAVGTHIPSYVSDPDAQDAELHRSRLSRAKVAFAIGLLVPACLTALVTWRRRRGGPYPRGIFLEVTADGELRLWGRGYGSRVPLAKARLQERLVDLYAGRLGAWRQRRLRVSNGGRSIEFGTLAADDDGGMRLEGGEGDCVEVDRDDYFAIKAAVERLVES